MKKILQAWYALEARLCDIAPAIVWHIIAGAIFGLVLQFAFENILLTFIATAVMAGGKELMDKLTGKGGASMASAIGTTVAGLGGAMVGQGLHTL